MNLEEAAEAIVAVNACPYSVDDPDHQFKLKSCWVNLVNFLSDLSTTPSCQNDCVDYVSSKLKEHYLQSDKGDTPITSSSSSSSSSQQLVCARLYCNLLRLCEGNSLAKALPTDRYLLNELTQRLKDITSTCDSHSPETLCHTTFLLSWLAMLLLIPIPIEESIITTIEHIALKHIELSSQLTKVSTACLSSVIIRASSSNKKKETETATATEDADRMPLLEEYRDKLSPTSFYSIVAELASNLSLLKSSEAEKLTSMTLMYLCTHDLEDIGSIRAALTALTHLLKEVELESTALSQVVGVSLNYMGSERFDIQSKASGLLSLLLNKHPDLRSPVLSRMFQIWEVDPLGRFSLGLLIFGSDFFTADQKVLEEEGLSYLNVCAQFMQSSMATRDEQLTYDLCCFLLWRVARSQPTGRLAQNGQAVLEALLRLAITAKDRMTGRAAVSVIQEVIGRGLVGDGGAAMGLIPCFEREGVARKFLVFDHVAAHSLFGYQVCISSIVDSFLMTPKEPLIQQNLRNLRRILQKKALDPKTSITLIHWLMEEIQSQQGNRNAALPLVRLITTLVWCDENQTPSTIFPHLRDLYKALQVEIPRCASLKIVSKKCSEIPPLETYVNLLIALIPKYHDQDEYITLLKETIHELENHKCLQSKGLIYDTLFQCIYLGKSELILKIVSPDTLSLKLQDRISNPKIKTRNESLVNLIFKFLILLKIDPEQAITSFHQQGWLDLLRYQVSRATLISTLILVIEFMCLMLTPLQAYNLSQFLLLHPQSRIQQLAVGIESVFLKENSLRDLAQRPCYQEKPFNILHPYIRYMYRCVPLWDTLAMTDSKRQDILADIFIESIIYGCPKHEYNDTSAHYDSIPNWKDLTISIDYFHCDNGLLLETTSRRSPQSSTSVTTWLDQSTLQMRVAGFFNGLGSSVDAHRARDFRSFIYRDILGLKASSQLRKVLDDAAVQLAEESRSLETPPDPSLALNPSIENKCSITPQNWIWQGTQSYQNIIGMYTVTSSCETTEEVVVTLDSLLKLEEPLQILKGLNKLSLQAHVLKSLTTQ